MFRLLRAQVSDGLIGTVDTRFDGGRHLRIARGIDGVTYGCGEPLWWNTSNSDFPTFEEVYEHMSLGHVVVLCEHVDWLDEKADDLPETGNLLVMSRKYSEKPEWSDIHFQIGIKLSRVMEIGMADGDIDDIAKSYMVTRDQVRECQRYAAGKDITSDGWPESIENCG